MLSDDTFHVSLTPFLRSNIRDVTSLLFVGTMLVRAEHGICIAQKLL